MTPDATPPDPPPGAVQVVERDIRTLLRRYHREVQQGGWQKHLADAITRFTGSIPFVYFHLLLFGGWIIANLPGVPLPHFDPTFVALAMVASVEAIFLSTFILITQNRMTAQAEKRADLDLQISLLAEHEITRLLALTMAIAAHLGLDTGHDPELAELAQDVAPKQVLDTLEALQDQATDATRLDQGHISPGSPERGRHERGSYSARFREPPQGLSPLPSGYHIETMARIIHRWRHACWTASP
jgi:uncharacterized membrane protein